MKCKFYCITDFFTFFRTLFTLYVSKLAFLFSEIREIIMMDEAVLRATTL